MRLARVSIQNFLRETPQVSGCREAFRLCEHYCSPRWCMMLRIVLLVGLNGAGCNDLLPFRDLGADQVSELICRATSRLDR